MLPIRFTPIAERSIRNGLGWWAQNRDKNPNRLEDELANALEMLAESPNVGRATLTPGVRKLALKVSRHVLYYSPGDDHILVLQLWQGSQELAPY